MLISLFAVEESSQEKTAGEIDEGHVGKSHFVFFYNHLFTYGHISGWGAQIKGVHQWAGIASIVWSIVHWKHSRGV